MQECSVSMKIGHPTALVPTTSKLQEPIVVTSFPEVKQPQGKRRKIPTWRDMYRVFETPASGHGAAKNSLAGWSCATFRDDRRAKPNVLLVSGLVLDYDNSWELADAEGKTKLKVPEAELATFERAIGAWPGCCQLLHTSYSHAPEWPRFRQVIPYARPVTCAEHELIWRWADSRLAELDLYPDETCSDGSRFWFSPTRKDEHYQARWVDGDALDVDVILALVEEVL